jgi:hypothetical protein
MAMIGLRAALMSKMSWTRQQLSSRVQRVRKILPVNTATAHAVIAHQQGMKIDRYLDDDELVRVQTVIAKLGAGNSVKQAASEKVHLSRAGRGPARRSVASNPTRSIVFPQKFKLSDPVLGDFKLREAREMAEVYPLLYVLENSMRELVQRVMKAKYGLEWWDAALTSGKLKTLKTNSDARREKERLQSWHQRRGAHAIDYIDLGQLGEIIVGRQDDFFPHVLGDNRAWFEQFMRELEPSRNVLCHMNPLDPHNIADLKVKAARWSKLVTERLTYIPDTVSVPSGD